MPTTDAIREVLLSKLPEIVARLGTLLEPAWHPYEEPGVRVMSTKLIFSKMGLSLDVTLRDNGMQMTIEVRPITAPFPEERTFCRDWPRETLTILEPLHRTTSAIWDRLWEPRESAEAQVVTMFPQKIKEALES